MLRKFLFIMHYRNKTFHSRFSKSLQDYNANDRQSMIEFMSAEKLHHPIEVWFRNIAAILDADFEDYPNFIKDAPRLAATYHAYPPDMSWFLKNMQADYLAFVTPTSSDLEFILTENAFSVFEGPCGPQAWTDYHLFSPISPNLLIVSRSIILGTGNAEDEAQLSLPRSFLTSIHRNLGAAGESLLQDLPVHQARNNYSQIVNGKNEALPVKMSRDKHIFYFPLFKVTERQVGCINTIFFDNASSTSAIIYRDVSPVDSASAWSRGDGISDARIS